MSSKTHVVTIELKSGRTVQVAVTKFTSSQIDDPKTGKSNYNKVEWTSAELAVHRQLKKSGNFPNLTRLSSINCAQVEAIAIEEAE